MRVAVCLPCTDTVMSAFALDWFRLAYHMGRTRPDVTLIPIQNRGTILPQQRDGLVQAAMQAEATHVFWLDSDMRFPPDTLERLLAHQQPIVAANYTTRRPPYLPTAELDGHGSLFTPADASGLAQVSRCGLGVCLVSIEVYAAVHRPWFQIGYNGKDGQYVGEDFFFFKRAVNHGYSVLIDQDLSREVGHVGTVELTAQHAMLTLERINAAGNGHKLELAK